MTFYSRFLVKIRERTHALPHHILFSFLLFFFLFFFFLSFFYFFASEVLLQVRICSTDGTNTEKIVVIIYWTKRLCTGLASLTERQLFLQFFASFSVVRRKKHLYFLTSTAAKKLPLNSQTLFCQPLLAKKNKKRSQNFVFGFPTDSVIRKQYFRETHSTFLIYSPRTP